MRTHADPNQRRKNIYQPLDTIRDLRVVYKGDTEQIILA